MKRQYLVAVALVGAALLATPVEAATLSAQAELPLAQQFVHWLANPNVAYVLFVLGLLGLVGEVVTGGAIFPGVAGTICLVLALVGLGQLPTNWGGAALMLGSLSMFLLDIKVPGHGLSVGGALAFGLGSLLLFTPFWVVAPAGAVSLSPWVILWTTGGVAAFFVLGAAAGLRAQRAPVAAGKETVIGKLGTVETALAPEGIVHVEGEQWSARPAWDGTIPAGCQVRVIGIEGLVLKVEAVDPMLAPGA